VCLALKVGSWTLSIPELAGKARYGNLLAARLDQNIEQSGVAVRKIPVQADFRRAALKSCWTSNPDYPDLTDRPDGARCGCELAPQTKTRPQLITVARP
jgi:hypothetical protein